MTLLIKSVLDPFNILWVLTLIGVVCYFFKKKALSRYLFISSAIWFILISTPTIPTILLDSLESQYQPASVGQLQQSDRGFHIVVLGGGHGFDERLPANSLLSSTALGRLNEGIRIYRQMKGSKLILSGYSSSGRTTQAEMLKDAALLLGVTDRDIMIQKTPGNTLEEATVYANKYGGTKQVILVTSAVHMPRAVMLFERVGINVIPSPANYQLKGSWRDVRFGFPAMENIIKLRSAIHEYAAIAKYTLI